MLLVGAPLCAPPLSEFHSTRYNPYMYGSQRTDSVAVELYMLCFFLWHFFSIFYFIFRQSQNTWGISTAVYSGEAWLC
jgi:hypothetical protein